jgi:GNAT superfamily N-acetyltransferase
MTPLTYRIRPAEPDDLPAVIGLRRYAEQWLAAASIDQWTSSATGDRVITEHFEQSRSYVVDDEFGVVSAALALGDGDADFWTPAELASPALYLYKFITGPTARGTGLGDVLLDWACYQAEMAWMTFLRLDCHRTNTGLHQYYRSRGFYHLGTRYAEGRMSGALFERIAETRLAKPPRVTLVDATEGGQLFASPSQSAAV